MARRADRRDEAFAKPIDSLTALLSSTGILASQYVLDGSYRIRDVSRRNRNHRATWGDGDGVLVKQAGPFIADAEATLRNEIGFYEACGRLRDGQSLPIVELVTRIEEPPLLVLRLSRNAQPLWEWRKTSGDPRKVYDALGRALASFHAFAASASFAADTYARSLPEPALPWALSLHQPSPSMLRTASHAHLDTVRIIQHETNLGEHLESLAAKLRPTQVIHADMKADNILVENGERVSLVDWELAQLGDPAWDVGGVLADTLLSWLFSLSPQQGGVDAVATVARAAEPTRFAHGACSAFWMAYEAGVAPALVQKEALFEKAILCTAAHLVRHAFEDSYGRTLISNQAVASLQVAVNLFAAPTQGASVLLGLFPAGSA